MRRKAKISTTPLPTGKPCKPTKEQLSIPLSLCKQKRFRRRSPGAPIERVISVNDNIPDPASFADPVERASAEKALAYMGLKPGIPLTEVAIDKVFIGSCTNSRIEDLRAAAEIAKGRKVAPGVQALVVPGSGPVKAQAEAEGLDKIFIEAGFEWRLPGCSMCLAMNNDRLNPGERCASTSNRNFEGRQGAAGARIWSVRQWLPPRL